MKHILISETEYIASDNDLAYQIFDKAPIKKTEYLLLLVRGRSKKDDF